MTVKNLIMVSVSAAMLVLPAERLQADGSAFVGGVVGGVLGSVITNGIQQNRQQTRTRTVQRAAPSCGASCQARRSEARDMQSALNYFGYNAGAVDGRPGPQTRRAVTAYESEMGFYADGNLDPQERAFLMSSFHRAQSGSYGPHQQAYMTGGHRGLLRSFNDERTGRFNGGVATNGTGFPNGTNGNGFPNGTVQFPNGNVGANPNGNFNQGNVPGNGGVLANAPTVVPPAAPAPAPDPAPAADPFAGGFNVQPVAVSMANHCTETQRLTGMNGGYIQAASAANASQALSEQFCLAREFTKTKGQQLISSIAGMTAADVLARCEQIAGGLAPAISALSSQPRTGVIDQVKQMASAMDDNTKAQTGEICVSVGYAEDNPKVTLAGALLLVAAGQDSYGEIVGHHLREGFGTVANADQAKMWHIETITAMDAGAPAAILPGQAAQRNSVIRSAYGESVDQAVVIPNVSASGTLPTFVVQPSPN